MLKRILPLLHRYIFAVLLAFAVGLIISAFVLEYGFHAKPCLMCWWQRYAHWSIAAFAVLGIALPRLRTLLLLAIAATATVGLGIALWQSGAQLGLWQLPPFCGTSTAPLAEATNLLATLQTEGAPPACNGMGFTIFHVSLAMWNIPTMVFVIFTSLYALKKGY
ncbi:MAG: disulfide bond formation protein B [Alphaproteobacteria bacterium]